MMNSDKIDSLMDIYKNISKNNRGDLITSASAPSSLVNPFTGEEEPVYSQEEAAIIEDIHNIEDIINEHERALENESDGEERIHITRDIDTLEENLDSLEHELTKLRAKSEVNAKEEAEIRRKNNKERMAKKKANDIEKMKKDRQNAEELAERQKLLDTIPDDLKEAMNRLF